MAAMADTIVSSVFLNHFKYKNYLPLSEGDVYIAMKNDCSYEST